jgi:hypothetical protein
MYLNIRKIHNLNVSTFYNIYDDLVLMKIANIQTTLSCIVKLNGIIVTLFNVFVNDSFHVITNYRVNWSVQKSQLRNLCPTIITKTHTVLSTLV